MCNYSYTLLKISWRLYDKHYTKLNDKQKSKVRDIYMMTSTKRHNG